MPSIQSVGLGSDVLKQSQIDDLKKVDEKALLDPIKENITKEQTKSSDLSSLSIAASGAKSAQNPLSEEASYLKTSASKEGTSVEATVEDGVSPRSLEFVVKSLATKEIIESNPFLSKTQAIIEETSNLEFYIKNSKYSIPIIGSKNLEEGQTATTYDELTSLIADKTNGNVIASILNIGGDTPFKMILQTKNEGSLNKILLGPSVRGDKTINLKSLEEELFTGKSFSINGVNILDGVTKAKITSEPIVIPEPLPFKTGNLFINDVDIFSTTDATVFKGEERLKLETSVKSDDLKINGIDIFHDSSKPEIQSNINISDISFPLKLQTQGMSINGVDIFNNIASTSVLSGTLNNSIVKGEYKDNNLVINGVNILEQKNGAVVAINSIQQLANAINAKKDTTNAEASIVRSGTNSRILIKSLVAGDNIDIYTNNNIQFSKFRLTQGSTKGEDTQLILNSTDLVNAINAKSSTSNAIAQIRDGKLTISSKDSLNLSINTLQQSTLAALGLKAQTSSQPVGIKISSMSALVEKINDATSQTKVKAKLENDQIVLTSLESGKDLKITGKTEPLSKFGLKATTIDPLKQKTITTIDDIIESINSHKDESKVQATKKGNKIVIEALNNDTNIQIKGDINKLTSIGLKEEQNKFKNGQILSSRQQLADLINLKYIKTGVKADIKNDRILLYNPSNSRIVITGETDKLSLLGLSEKLSHKPTNNLGDLTLHKKLGFNDSDNLIQKAANSSFLYNNVSLERDTNTINDLVPGVSIKLKHIDTESSKSRIDITTDTTLIETSVKEFITAYNSFIRKLEDLTKFDYDETKGIKDSVSGSFQGIPSIVNIPYQFNSIITTFNSNLKEIKNLEAIGVTFLDKSNSLEINESTLKNAISSNFEEVQKLLMGHKYISSSGREETFNGVFKDINAEFNKLTQGDKSTFKILEDKISTDKSRLEANLEKNQNYLDEKYKQMQQEFIANDLAISKINNNFNSLKQQIELETSKS